jgi:hypothetical protein
MLWSRSSRRHGEGQALHGHRRIGVYRAAGLLGVVRGVCAESLAHPAPNHGVHVAVEKASILRVQVPSCQLPESGTERYHSAWWVTIRALRGVHGPAA